MRILFVLEYFSPHIGGAETLFEQLVQTLVQKGHKVTVLTTRLPGTQAAEKKNGLQILGIKTPPFARRYWFTLLAIPRAINLAREHDIIHTTTYNAALPAWLAAKITGKKIILHVLEVFGRQWFALGEKNLFLSLGFYFYEKLLFILPFNYYIAISQYTKNNLKNFFSINSKKISVVYPQIDKALWNPQKYNREEFRKKLGLKNEFVYLYFGRPGITKGVEYLIRAVSLVKKKIPRSKLVLILALEPKNRFVWIKRMIKSFNLQNDVILMSSVSKEVLPGFVKAADCVIIPSLSEGFGLSALEAASMGVPVVATKVGALPKVIFGRYLFIKPKDVISLAEGIIAVNKGKLETRRTKVWETKEQIFKYLNIYEELLETKRKMEKLSRLRSAILSKAEEKSLLFGMKGLFHISSDIVWQRFFAYLLFLAKNLPERGRVLDAGCGLGQNACMLKILRPDLEVIGVDIYQPQIWKELKVFGCQLKKGNVLSSKFKNNFFDAIMSFGVMEHLSGKDLIFLREMYKLLKPKGKLFIFHLPNRLSWSEKLAGVLRIWHHQQKYSKSEVEKLFAQTEFVKVEIVSHDLIPGQFGRVNKQLEFLTNFLSSILFSLDNLLLRTPFSVFAQNFSVSAQKEAN